MARQRTVRTLVKKLYILRDNTQTRLPITKSAKREIEDSLGLSLNLVN
jgi:hypothetical protein